MGTLYQARKENEKLSLQKVSLSAGEEALSDLNERITKVENIPHGELVSTLPTESSELSSLIEDLPDGAVVLAVDEPGMGESSHVLGELVYSLLPVKSISHHLLDGSWLTTIVYDSFVEYVKEIYTEGKHTSLFCTNEEFEISLTTYGVCGKFVVEDDRVRLPKVTGFVEGTVDAAAVGSLVEAGLPNITGGCELYSEYTAAGGSGWGLGGQNYHGAIQPNSVQSVFYSSNSGHTDSFYDRGISIDASLSSPIYGNANTVQPQSIKGYIYMIVATAIKNTAYVDVDKVLGDINTDVSELQSQVNSLQSSVTTDVSELQSQVSSLQSSVTTDVSELQGQVNSLQSSVVKSVNGQTVDASGNVSVTTISGNAGSTTKLASARVIDGVDFDGTAAITHYGTCSTAAATAAKTVALTGFKLITGARVIVRFTVTNTAANPTLNVNNTGAKAIQYRNAAITAGYLAADRVYEFIYDGSAYELVGDINTDANTTYSAMTGATSSAAGKAGLVPAPAAGKQASFLRGDGTWVVPTQFNGGTITNDIAIQKSDPELYLQHSTLVKGTAPSAVENLNIKFIDSEGQASANSLGLLRVYVDTSNNNSVQLIAYNPVSGSTASAGITITYPEDGTPTIKGITPAAGDNSTQLATTAWVNANVIPSGTQMLFAQSAAPTGWTKQTSVNDAAIRVVSGSTGGNTGGSVAFSTAFTTGKSITLSGNVGATTLTVAQIPSHSHNLTTYNQQNSGYSSWLYKEQGNESTTLTTTATGSSGSHTHSLSGSATVNLNVKYLDTIVCKKN